MRRSASEVIRNLETRIARLEKSAGGDALPKKVLVELEDLLSDYPFNDSDPHREEYHFTLEANIAKELEFMKGMGNKYENSFFYKYEVEATITLNSYCLIRNSATIEDPRAKLYHLVDEALDQEEFRSLRVSGEIEVKRI